MTAVIHARGLTKRYANVTAVDDLSLRISAGEIYALLGLNGAGKTTTIRMVLGMVRPGLVTVVATAAMTVLLATPMAFAASAGRGFLPGVGVLMASIFCAQVVAALGYGQYFPWSVPALVSGLAGPDQAPAGPLGVLLVVAVGAAGAVATALWWRNADQDR